MIIEKLSEGGSSYLGAGAAPREVEGVVERMVGPGQLDEAVRYVGTLQPLREKLGLLQPHQAVVAAVDEVRRRVVGMDVGDRRCDPVATRDSMRGAP